MQKKYWVCQKRNAKCPWAIRAVCTYPRGTPKMPSVLFDIYSEELPGPNHCVSIDDRKYSSTCECSKAIVEKIKAFSKVTKDDEAQIERFANEILLNGDKHV